MSKLKVAVMTGTGQYMTIESMSVYWLGCETNCETDVPVDSDRHCPKMAVTLGFGWLLVLG